MNKTLFLIVNNLCHNNCKYCFYTTGHHSRSSARINISMIDNVSERIFKAGFTTVILTGGDPLYCKHKDETFALAKSLKDRGVKIILNTSAARFEKEDIERIKNLNIDRVDVSIDSCSERIHNYQRGNFKCAFNFIKELFKAEYQNITTTTVVTELSASRLTETILWLQDLGVKDTRIQRAFLPDDTSLPCGLIPSAMRGAARFLQKPHLSRYLLLTECAWSGTEILLEATCRMGKDYFVCDSRGGLSPCFHRTDLGLGNLFQDPTQEILESIKTNELTDQSLPNCFGKHCVSLFDNPNCWRR